MYIYLCLNTEYMSQKKLPMTGGAHGFVRHVLREYKSVALGAVARACISVVIFLSLRRSSFIFMSSHLSSLVWCC